MKLLWVEVASRFGRFAEWLGAGLQNQLQRFESATDLIKPLNTCIIDI